jgi:CIC family chloride channel protein
VGLRRAQKYRVTIFRKGGIAVAGLADFTTDGRRLILLSAAALALGVASGVVAFLLLRLIGLVTNLAYLGRVSTALVAPDPARWGPWAIGVPVVGALVVGLIARYGTDKVRGHGIPEAIQAILEDGARMPAKVAFWKPLASAIAIGTGGPFGAEGPIIMTGGAVGSLVAQILPLSSLERRVLLVAGAAGGMAATFGAPISSVLLAVELLLFEWRPRSLVPVTVAAGAAYGMRVLLLGAAPPFATLPLPAPPVGDLPFSLVVGLAGGVVSGLLTKAVYLAEDLYPRLPLHWMWWPAVGGLVVGLGGAVVPQALGVGYPTIRALDAGQVAIGMAVALLLVKGTIWAVSLGSGTSGGVLAPLLLLGGALGTLLGRMLPGPVGLWATVGVAAMLGGTMRAPFTAAVFTLETTHDFGAVTAAFLASVAATAVTAVWIPRSILTEKVARRGVHVAREYSVHPLEAIAVRQIMTARASVLTLSPTMLLTEAAARLAGEAAGAPEDPIAAVVDEGGRLLGLVRGSAVWARLRAREGDTVADVVAPAVRVGAMARARHAVEEMARTGRRELAVMDADGDWAGVVSQGDVLKAWRRALDEEEQRSAVWPLRVRHRRRRSVPAPRLSDEAASGPHA